MHFDEQAVGADSGGSACHGKNLFAASGAVAGIDNDGKVATAVDGGDDAEVQSIAGVVGKRSNAALTEDHVWIALGDDVFRRQEKLVKCGGKAALEQDWFFGAAGALEEREVLHAASADLNHIGVTLDEVEAFVIYSLSDDAQAETLADPNEDLQSRFAETLKTVGRRTWFVGATAEQSSTSFFHALGNGFGLFDAFNGARAGDQDNIPAADVDRAQWSWNRNYSNCGFEIAANELVRLGHLQAFKHSRHDFECGRIDRSTISGDGDRRTQGTGNGLSAETQRLNAITDGMDLVRRRTRLHDDQHGLSHSLFIASTEAGHTRMLCMVTLFRKLHNPVRERRVYSKGGKLCKATARTELVPIGMFDSLASDSYHAEESRVADKC
jgi:hypothetical protein